MLGRSASNYNDSRKNVPAYVILFKLKTIKELIPREAGVLFYTEAFGIKTLTLINI